MGIFVNMKIWLENLCQAMAINASSSGSNNKMPSILFIFDIDKFGSTLVVRNIS
jgi:hypothetical protein